MIVVILIKKIIALFLIMGMGILLVKCRILKESDSRVISALSIHLIVPCVILAAFQVDFTEEIGKGLLLALAAVLIVILALRRLLGRRPRSGGYRNYRGRRR